jgi:hypothetical protein
MPPPVQCFFAHTDAELRTPPPALTTAPATPQLQQGSAAPLAGLLHSASPAAGSPQLQAAAAALAAGAGLATVNDATLLLYAQQQAVQQQHQQQQQVSSGLSMSSLGLQLGLQPPGLAAMGHMSQVEAGSFTSSSYGTSFTTSGGSSSDSITSHAVLAGLGLGGSVTSGSTGDSGPLLVLLDGQVCGGRGSGVRGGGVAVVHSCMRCRWGGGGKGRLLPGGAPGVVC